MFFVEDWRGPLVHVEALRLGADGSLVSVARIPNGDVDPDADGGFYDSTIYTNGTTRPPNSITVQHFNAALQRVKTSVVDFGDNMYRDYTVRNSLVLPDGDLLLGTPLSANRFGITKITLDAGSPKSPAPSGTSKPSVTISFVSPPRAGDDLYVGARYRCSDICGATKATWTLQRIGGPERKRQSSPIFATTQATFDDQSGWRVSRGKYRVSVEAVDAFGRTATRSKLFTVRS
jgi:hypothetical protein